MWSIIFGKFVTIFQNKNMRRQSNSTSLKLKNSKAYPDNYLENKRKKAIMYLKKRGIYIKDLINNINGDKYGKNERKITRGSKRGKS